LSIVLATHTPSHCLALSSFLCLLPSTTLIIILFFSSFFFFFFNDTATTEIYTLSLHDALPISGWARGCSSRSATRSPGCRSQLLDRKSTRLNSSHVAISYAVFCLKKKNKTKKKNNVINQSMNTTEENIKALLHLHHSSYLQ